MVAPGRVTGLPCQANYKAKGFMRLNFKPPKNWAPPEGAELKDGYFDAVCTFCLEKDGTLTLEKLGDTDIESEDESKAGVKESKPDYSSYSKPMMASMESG